MGLDSNSSFQALTKATGEAIRQCPQQVKQETSNHLQIIREHGERTHAPRTMVDFYVKLAEPAIVGGVVVLLERPSPAEETRYGGGYETVISRTPTFRWLEKLLRIATNNTLGIADVTILDAFPLQPNASEPTPCDESCSRLLARLLAAKRPDMVISCFTSRGHEGVIRAIQHLRIGGEMTANSRPIQLHPPSSHRFQVVDAFHPSFYFTHHQEECFLDLLKLQFAMAFGLWRKTWPQGSESQAADLAWMLDTRQIAASSMAVIQEDELTNKMSSLDLRNSTTQRYRGRTRAYRYTIHPLPVLPRLLAQAQPMGAPPSS